MNIFTKNILEHNTLKKIQVIVETLSVLIIFLAGFYPNYESFVFEILNITVILGGLVFFVLLIKLNQDKRDLLLFACLFLLFPDYYLTHLGRHS